MTRAAYFVVQRVNGGGEQPAIYWDALPAAPLRHLVYIVRLDEQPNGADLCAASLDQLFTVFKMLRARGKLPPRWEPPKQQKAGATTTKVGHRESQADVIQRTRHIDS